MPCNFQHEDNGDDEQPERCCECRGPIPPHAFRYYSDPDSDRARCQYCATDFAQEGDS